MEHEYTVPALADTAERLRTDATTLVAEAEIHARQLVEEARRRAEQMRAAAARLAVLAEQERATAEAAPAGEQACGRCGHPLVHDGLGWKHLDPYAPCSPGQPVAGGGQYPAETGPMAAAEQDGGEQR